MSKFTLKPNPTFKANVKIPVAGQEQPEIVTFTFNHFPLSELETMKEKPVDEFYQTIINNWAITEPYDSENLKVLFDNYPSSPSAITATYYSELLGNREKN